MFKRIVGGTITGCVLALALASCTDRPTGQQLPEEPNWMQLYEAQVEQHAELLRSAGYEPPTDAQFVRFIELEEYATVHIDCLQQQGIAARATFDGGIDFSGIPAEQAQAQHEALHRCQVMYPTHPRYSLPATPEQVRVTYDYLRDTLVPCLVAEGYKLGDHDTTGSVDGSSHGMFPPSSSSTVT